MKRHALRLALMVCVLSTGLLWAVEPNLAPNPSFEEGEAGRVLGWAFWNWARKNEGAGTHVGTWDDQAAHTGTRSLRIQGVEAGKVGVWDNKHGGALIAVEAGKTYELSFWARTHTLPGEGVLDRVIDRKSVV